MRAHRGAFEYDWRARFSVPLTVVGRSMTWGEAKRLTDELLRDPASHITAALVGWSHPVSHEALALADLYDATTNAHFKKPKPYPRPWPDPNKQRFGSRVEDVAATLAAHRAAADAERQDEEGVDG